jgi:ribosomal protein L21E
LSECNSEGFCLIKMKGKQVRQRGKVKLSSYFKKIDEGNSVALNIDEGMTFSFPRRFQGRSGKVVGTRGDCKLVEIKDGGKNKIFIVHPIHLRNI